MHPFCDSLAGGDFVLDYNNENKWSVHWYAAVWEPMTSQSQMKCLIVYPVAGLWPL